MEKNESQKKILIVEDEVPLLKIIKKKLEDAGFQTAQAQTVSEALDILGGGKIDAIWLDHYLLGEKSGFDLVMELKTSGSGWGKTPIFVVSNTAGPDDIRSYIQLGVDKYYVKSNSTLGVIVDDLKNFFDVNSSAEAAEKKKINF